jgi:hypothetical protein
MFTRVPLEAISNVYKLYEKYSIKIKNWGCYNRRDKKVILKRMFPYPERGFHGNTVMERNT